MRRARGRAPARRRARRRAGRLPRRAERAARPCAEALVARRRPGGELGVPVFLYGALAGGRTRAELRRGGAAELALRIADGELRPTSAPRGCIRPPARRSSPRARRSSRSTSSWRAPATLDDARAIAARDPRGRRGGPAGRARDRAVAGRARRRRAGLVQRRGPPRRCRSPRLLAAVARHAPVAEAELVGLAPRGRASRACPRTSRSAARPARPLEERLQATSRPWPRPRKRRTKHRGNAAGIVETRGRTGRKPAPAEKQAGRRARSAGRARSPPTVASALNARRHRRRLSSSSS